MLDANTLQWLEDRDALQFMFDQCTLPDGAVSFDDDIRDNAEFESRVKRKIASGFCYRCDEFYSNKDCPVTLYESTELYRCRLKHARLAVEREMIREGKGPGRQEEDNGN